MKNNTRFGQEISMKKIILILSLTFISTQAFAGGEHEMPAIKSSLEFEKLKSLVGTWKGTSVDRGKTENATVEYTLTSGGSALVEKLFAGTPHEMVSVYHDTNGKLSMTHYCMLGNHPELELVSERAGAMEFDLKKNGSVDPKEQHMHGLRIERPDENTLVQKWQCWKDGKPEGLATVISLKRTS